MSGLASALADGLATLGVAADTGTRERLLAYVELLAHWNRTYNLTAIREPERMLTHHVLDSLSALPWVRGPRVLDVGSGGGLPGIPLALVAPQLSVTLLDSNSKKTAFLVHAVGALGLTQVEVAHARAEQFAPVRHYDTVVSRAFSDLRDFVQRTAAFATPASGRLVAMKGVLPHEELAQLDGLATLEAAHPVTVPGVEGQRHILVLAPATAAAA
jgi:16S rRNA (guanine527-N7)-methyltransferase